jgi:hypothetical protein
MRLALRTEGTSGCAVGRGFVAPRPASSGERDARHLRVAISLPVRPCDTALEDQVPGGVRGRATERERPPSPPAYKVFLPGDTPLLRGPFINSPDEAEGGACASGSAVVVSGGSVPPLVHSGFLIQVVRSRTVEVGGWLGGERSPTKLLRRHSPSFVRPAVLPALWQNPRLAWPPAGRTAQLSSPKRRAS